MAGSGVSGALSGPKRCQKLCTMTRHCAHLRLRLALTVLASDASFYKPVRTCLCHKALILYSVLARYAQLDQLLLRLLRWHFNWDVHSHSPLLNSALSQFPCRQAPTFLLQLWPTVDTRLHSMLVNNSEEKAAEKTPATRKSKATVNARVFDKVPEPRPEDWQPKGYEKVWLLDQKTEVCSAYAPAHAHAHAHAPAKMRAKMHTCTHWHMQSESRSSRPPIGFYFIRSHSFCPSMPRLHGFVVQSSEPRWFATGNVLQLLEIYCEILTEKCAWLEYCDVLFFDVLRRLCDIGCLVSFGCLNGGKMCAFKEDIADAESIGTAAS